MRAKYIIPLLLIALGFNIAASLASANKQVYLPAVWQSGVALEPVATVSMPFEVYNAVQPNAVQAASGYWYISVYRVGDSTGAWIVRWREGEDQVTAIGGTPNAPALAPIPDGPYSDARGTVACSRDHRIYQFSWEGSTRPKLFIGRLTGDTC